MKVKKSNRPWMAVLLAVVFVACSNLFADAPGLYVDGRFLYDKCGEKIVLKGSNAMILYWDRPGTITYPEIAKTGANVVRIFWNTSADSTAAEFDQTITNCFDNNMIPMPSVWDATGVWANLQACVNWWIRPDILAVVQAHEEHMLVNIANEAGDYSVTEQQFRDSYVSAINQMRAAGIHTPLVIDAAGWGRGENYVLNNGQYLLNADPEHNLIFSWHPYDPVTWGGTQQRIKTAIDTSIANNICMIIGEFAECEQGGNPTDCANTPIEWEYLITYASQNEVGWLPWVWWCCSGTGDSHSLTYDKYYGHWSNLPWGQSVAVTHQYSIQNTAARSYWLTHHVCGTPEYQATNPGPTDGATGVAIDANLTWIAGYGATSHDVYFGANPTPGPAEFKGNQTSTTFDPCVLDYNTTYFWAIDEVNDSNVTPGDVWSFTTIEENPPIAFDSTSANSSGNNGATLSWSHTIGNDNDRLLVVGVAAEGNVPGNMPVSGITYNGVPLTFVPGSAAQVGTTTLMRTELYYMLNDQLPAPGTYTVIVTYTGSVINRNGGAVSLFNVLQYAPEAVDVNTTTTGNTISTAITTLTDNAWVVDVVACGNSGSFTATVAGMTKRWGTSPNSSSAAGSTKPVGLAGATALSWLHSGANRMAHSLAEFAPANAFYPLGDLNFDHKVNLADLGLFADQWLTAGPEADLDESTNVDFYDFALFGQNWQL